MATRATWPSFSGQVTAITTLNRPPWLLISGKTRIPCTTFFNFSIAKRWRFLFREVNIPISIKSCFEIYYKKKILNILFFKIIFLAIKIFTRVSNLVSKFIYKRKKILNISKPLSILLFEIIFLAIKIFTPVSNLVSKFIYKTINLNISKLPSILFLKIILPAIKIFIRVSNLVVSKFIYI